MIIFFSLVFFSFLFPRDEGGKRNIKPSSRRVFVDDEKKKQTVLYALTGQYMDTYYWIGFFFFLHHFYLPHSRVTKRRVILATIYKIKRRRRCRQIDVSIRF